jgi:hypothetical protein
MFKIGFKYCNQSIMRVYKTVLELLLLLNIAIALHKLLKTVYLFTILLFKLVIKKQDLFFFHSFLILLL